MLSAVDVMCCAGDMYDQTAAFYRCAQQQVRTVLEARYVASAPKGELSEIHLSTIEVARPTARVPRAHGVCVCVCVYVCVCRPRSPTSVAAPCCSCAT